jgi:hypothetical protein
MAQTPAQRQKKAHAKKLLSFQTKAELEAYRALLRERSRISKRKQRAQKKEPSALEGHDVQLLANSAEVVGHETIPILKWEKKICNNEGDLPDYNKGDLIECPKTLLGDNAMAALVLEGLSDFLQKKWVSIERDEFRHLASLSLPKITGIRKINGNRYEFFVRVKDCVPAAFKTILRYSERMRRADRNLFLTDEELSKLIELIVGFATERSSVTPMYALQNFAYIVSFGPVKEQDVHIDLGNANEFQMAMLCTPQGELTTEYMCVDSHNAGEEGDNLSKLWKDMPAGLQAKLDKIEDIQPLLDGFGPLLSPEIKKVGQENSVVTFGDLLRLPGRVMHCGPKVTENEKLRAVLFFTATPNQDLDLSYDSETQYCRSTIIHDILLHSWPYLTPEEKQYILIKWVKVGLSQDSGDAIAVNMNHKHLITIASALKAKKGIGLEQLVSKIANDKKWKHKNFKLKWLDTSKKEYKIPK